MSRAEIRRAEKAEKKRKTATYNFTEAQLDDIIQEKIGKAIDEMKQEATEEAVNTAFALLLTIPMEVLMDFYWKKTYAKRIPEFTNHILKYYEMWENGELDMDEMREDLWKYAGIRLEAEKETDNE